MSNIHVFGDSHSNLYATLKNTKIWHLGAVTVFRVGRDGIGVFNFESKDIRSGDSLAFVFGEIDLRVHIGLQRDRFSVNPIELMDELVTSYMTVLIMVASKFSTSSIWVMSAVPPAGSGYANFDPRFPRNGSDSDRVVWTRHFNQQLQSQALSNQFSFVDQYSPFSNENGLLDLGVTTDGVHVDQAYVNRVTIPRPELLSRTSSQNI